MNNPTDPTQCSHRYFSISGSDLVNHGHCEECGAQVNLARAFHTLAKEMQKLRDELLELTGKEWERRNGQE